MYEELRKAICKGAYQVCLYDDFIVVWVKDRESRINIIENASELDVSESRMRGSIFIIRIKMPNAKQVMMGVDEDVLC